MLACLSPLLAEACGYHDPMVIRIGILNWYYPDSLHVTGAISDGQRVGELPPIDKRRILAKGRDRVALDLQVYRQITEDLRAMGAALQKMTPPGQAFSFSLVLVESALWSRLIITDRHVLPAIDVASPAEGDLVVVTGQPVLAAIRSGMLTLDAGIEKGMIKLYGEPEQKVELRQHYGQLGSVPLESEVATPNPIGDYDPLPGVGD